MYRLSSHDWFLVDDSNCFGFHDWFFVDGSNCFGFHDWFLVDGSNCFGFHSWFLVGGFQWLRFSRLVFVGVPISGVPYKRPCTPRFLEASWSSRLPTVDDKPIAIMKFS